MEQEQQQQLLRLLAENQRAASLQERLQSTSRDLQGQTAEMLGSDVFSDFMALAAEDRQRAMRTGSAQGQGASPATAGVRLPCSSHAC